VCLMDRAAQLDGPAPVEMRPGRSGASSRLGSPGGLRHHDQDEAHHVHDQVYADERGLVEQDAPGGALRAPGGTPPSRSASSGTPPMNVLALDDRGAVLGYGTEDIRVLVRAKEPGAWSLVAEHRVSQAPDSILICRGIGVRRLAVVARPARVALAPGALRHMRGAQPGRPTRVRSRRPADRRDDVAGDFTHSLDDEGHHDQDNCSQAGVRLPHRGASPVIAPGIRGVSRYYPWRSEASGDEKISRSARRTDFQKRRRAYTSKAILRRPSIQGPIVSRCSPRSERGAAPAVGAALDRHVHHDRRGTRIVPFERPSHRRGGTGALRASPRYVNSQTGGKHLGT